ncbi:LarC family nickel insertion protein [Hoeflea sp.]|uniref:LarC family nickel insertion protein n=1 Tax=Hoeflea sp. TaxID=1940281 RepID=UPI003A8D7A5B
MRHLHLDPVGGIAGDMFAAALLDLMPELEPAALDIAAALLGSEADVSLDRSPVGGFAGARLKVRCRPGTHARHLPDILAMLEGCDVLSEAGCSIACEIFTRLAQAEAEVHGKSIDAIHFHEVGAADSILDIALAGYLIDASGAHSWSVGALPLGGGTVNTEHGVMPVPAPATARLLKGFVMCDDGVSGERVTPTGAAILAHLRTMMPAGSGAPAGNRVMSRTGTGFGFRTLPDRPNALRVIELLGADQTGEEQMLLLACEIDDQTGEDLAHGVEIIRATPGVRDVTQIPCLGKKGRMVVSLQVLAEPYARDTICAAIFAQTTTLGIREQTVQRHVLPREQTEREGVRVKLAQRGDTVTRKAEFDDIARNSEDHAGREALRRKAEDNE